MKKLDYPINPKAECLTDLKKYKYEIPVYQRYYSWEEDQIDAFLTTIINGYTTKKERCFFGTMQFHQEDINENKYQVIDGQQRLTTIILFFHVLDILSKESSEKLPKINIKMVCKNAKNANREMKKVLSCYNLTELNKKPKTQKSDISETYSLYEANARMLYEKCKLYKQNGEIDSYAKLSEYTLQSLYVVTLTTKSKEMSLPEIVDIFNTINTTGMDLNGADVFKIQYFGYLNKACKKTDVWMKKINRSYELIENYNLNRPKKEHIYMSDVLTLYKHFICALRNSSFKELSKSNERYFDDVLKTNIPEEYLSYEVFNRIVEIYLSVYSKIDTNQICPSSMITWSDKLIQMTRYSRYWTLPYLYVCFYWYKNRNKNKRISKSVYENALDMTYNIFKFFVVNSTNYAKIITSVQTIICNEIFPLIVSLDIKGIKDKISSILWINPQDKKTPCQDTYKNQLVNDGLAKTEVGIRLACMLLALDSEMSINTPYTEIKRKFFGDKPYDIEHTYSWSLVEKKYTRKNDKDKMNGLGNLVLLERDINQDMGRRKDLQPRVKASKHYYDRSDYNVVKELIPELSTWDINSVTTKGTERMNKLLNILSVS